MRVEGIPHDARVDELLEDRRMFLGFEGGAVYRATWEGSPCLLLEEGTVAFLLDEEDREGLTWRKVLVFEDEEELLAYARERWPRLTPLTDE